MYRVCNDEREDSDFWLSREEETTPQHLKKGLIPMTTIIPSKETFVPCRVSRLIGHLIITAVLAGLFLGSSARGASVLWKSGNVAVYIGLPISQLEFENPLSGTESVLSYPILDWRDADYAMGPPRWYDDWSVSDPTGIDGNVNEIWMRDSSHSIWTSTTVPSSLVSIHLIGDSNDGHADVYVDGVLVAQLDMYHAVGSETALVVVKGLGNTTHQVTIQDAGDPSGGLRQDVATLGAAALGEAQVKWEQPPEPVIADNIFNGWNEPSVPPDTPLAADDWVCTSTNPVTEIRWWGSFLGWQQLLPPQLPQSFTLTFWTDVPAAAGAEPFSHPGVALHQIICTNFSVRFAGWDVDPRTGQMETCFEFHQVLAPEEWFWQQDYQDPAQPTNILWLSIGAAPSPDLWGWKTRPRDPASPAPDDAVRIFDPSLPTVGSQWGAGDPIWWPTETNSWDLAFELIESHLEVVEKWVQLPDLSPEGMDVHATDNPQQPPPIVLADDFLCTSSGPLTHITVWASWLRDEYPDFDPGNVQITLSIHDDIPDPDGPGPEYSMPGNPLWLAVHRPGQFTWAFEAENIEEGWMDPFHNTYLFPGDWTCVRYDFYFATNDLVNPPFHQEGSEVNPMVYWLDVQAQPLGMGSTGEPVFFGWKTSIDHWNDDATWIEGVEPISFGMPWQELRYPAGHPFFPESVDLAFRLGSLEIIRAVKWSQPPVPVADRDAYNGWNEPSLYDGPQIAADDWVCTNAQPITDIHWWGSYLGWMEQEPPQLPDAFVLTIWTDVPAGVDQLFSHPGDAIWQDYCTEFTCQFVGWDIDPRDPNIPPEACFKFEQDLLEDEWFWQERGTNIYWLSIAPVFSTAPSHDWGWKTRPRDPESPAPDDAVRIYLPTAPTLGSTYGQGEPLEWPPGVSWDLAFTLTTKEQPEEYDFADAPDGAQGTGPNNYQTRLADSGAHHRLIANTPYFDDGSGADQPDGEPDGQPDSSALGDDNDTVYPPVNDDEDGIVFTAPLTAGQPGSVIITVDDGWGGAGAGQAWVDAWIDFNADGDWVDSGEQILSGWLLQGPNNVGFTVPAGASVGQTFARFRINSGGPLLPTGGPAQDGEVEDHVVVIKPPEMDYGDAPDTAGISGYQTVFANNGARHLASGILLGSVIDVEPDGQPTIAADGDDLNGPDEDGILFTTALMAGVPASIQVSSSSGGILQGWVDFDDDQNWGGPSEQIISDMVIPVGTTSVSFSVPTWATGGADGVTYARFRISSLLGLGYAGQAPDGEVEDYVVHFEELKWLQIPEQGSEGVDVNNAVYLLADDFLCTQSGPITDIHLWGSFHQDQLPAGGPGTLTFELSIWSDVPSSQPPGYSHPGEKLWSKTFLPHQYQAGRVWTVGNDQYEWWHDPGTSTWIPKGDTNIYQFDFYPLPHESFVQVGSEQNPVVYWLAVKYNHDAGGTFQFGWKTTPDDWNDDACYYDPSNAPVFWRDLHYGGGHPREPESLNLAFALSGEPGVAKDWGDAPDPTYRTLSASSGASHIVTPGFMLGRAIDAELDGQPTLLADGDDQNPLVLDDEDGVALPANLVRGSNMTANVFLTSVSGVGVLDAWLDVDGDGAWTPPDQVVSGQTLVSGANAVTFAVPANAVLGTNYMRFRLTSGGIASSASQATDGEVEDYITMICQRKLAGPVRITNITVTNITGGQVVALQWNAEAGILYQMQQTLKLGAPHPITWSDVGLPVVGPANTLVLTNTPGGGQRYYRVRVPYVCP